MPAKEEKAKDPIIAVLLSIYFLGLGQMYAGSLKRGLIFLGINLGVFAASIVYLLNPNTGLGVAHLIVPISLLLFNIYVYVDACLCCSKRNRSRSLSPPKAKKRFIIVAIVAVLGFALPGPSELLKPPLADHLLQAFKIPTNGMAPMLVKGDRIIVDKRIYKTSEPQRGDIVVFRYPKDEKRIFIKRIVGLGEEIVSISKGDVFIDGMELKVPEIISSLVYIANPILDYGKEGQQVSIPNGQYFVLGDSSRESSDSRKWGFVPQKNILGKVTKIYYPFSRAGTVGVQFDAKVIEEYEARKLLLEEEVKLEVDVDKTELNNGEQLTLIYKLVSRRGVELQGVYEKRDFDGFIKVSQGVVQTINKETIEYEGKTFLRAEVFKILLKAVSPGKHIIKPSSAFVIVDNDDKMMLDAEPIEVLVNEPQGSENGGG